MRFYTIFQKHRKYKLLLCSFILLISFNGVSQNDVQTSEKHYDNNSLEKLLSQELDSQFEVSSISPEKRLGIASHFYTNDESYFKSLKDKLEKVSRLLKKHFEEYSQKMNLNSITYRFYHKTDRTKYAEITVDYHSNHYTNIDVFALFQNEQMTVHKVYPVPAHDFLKIDYDMNTNDYTMNAKWQIHNILGNLVAEKELSHFETTNIVSLENLDPGLYFYTVILDSKPLLTKKIRIY